MAGSSSRQLQNHFHRPLPDGLYPDAPDTGEDILNLFTLPYSQLIETLCDILFPPRRVTVAGLERTMRASEARIDRYIHFRAVWQPEFGKRIQLALRDLADHCARRETTHFANLTPARQEAVLEALEVDELPGWPGTGDRSARRTFQTIFEAVSEGLLGEPGYGGNDRGLGWQYSNFMPVEELQ